ncbi:hypothetical protein LSH36_400g01058 [Paralvinella palmiformis]|uniref:Laminin N-terminal domain-containing protein n=1 Tax=Paralvinella palmiformis TaxID=53620 RepID=A0AAD9JD44_9ANNE|nr:hypothetical protein LSH36_400g01058 [Paralvinella palmiformis]
MDESRGSKHQWRQAGVGFEASVGGGCLAPEQGPDRDQLCHSCRKQQRQERRWREQHQRLYPSHIRRRNREKGLRQRRTMLLSWDVSDHLVQFMLNGRIRPELGHQTSCVFTTFFVRRVSIFLVELLLFASQILPLIWRVMIARTSTWMLVALLFCLSSAVNAQICSPQTDCIPDSEDLLVQGLPDRILLASSQCDTPTVTTYEDLFGDAKYECNGSTPHPSSLMIDRQPGGIDNYTFQSPDPQTYWQSVNTIDLIGAQAKEQTVVARFGSRFLIRYIRVIFIAPHIASPESGYDMRPKAMVIEKQDNDTSNWKPLRCVCMYVFVYL